MDFDVLEPLAFSLMGRRKSHLERETGAIYDHGMRVARLALSLRGRLFPQDASFDEVLRCAALFHDLGKGIGEHGHTGALLARDALAPHLTAAELDAVCALIRTHNQRRPGSGEFSPAALLLQDADLLDHYGSGEVWLNVSYSVYHGLRFHETADYYRNEWPQQIRAHRALLNFPFSRQIFDDRVSFSALYAARLEKESRGEIYGL